MRLALVLLYVRAQTANNTVTIEPSNSQVQTTVEATTVIQTTISPTTNAKPTIAKTTVLATTTTSAIKPSSSTSGDVLVNIDGKQTQVTTQSTTTVIPSIAAVSSSDSSSSNSFVVIYVFTGFLISAFVATGFAFFLIRRKESDRKVGRVLALEEQQVNSDKTIYDDKTMRSEAYSHPVSPPYDPNTLAYSNLPVDSHTNPYQPNFDPNYYDSSYYQEYQPYDMYTMNAPPVPSYPHDMYSFNYDQHPPQEFLVNEQPLHSKQEDTYQDSDEKLRPPSKLQKALSKIDTNAQDKALTFDILLNELNDSAEILSPESLNSAPFEFTHYNLPSGGADPVIRQSSIDDLALYSEYYTTPRNPNYRVSISDTAGYTFFMRESKDSSSRLFKTTSRMSIDTVVTRRSTRMSRYDTLRSRLSLKPNQPLHFKASVATLATEVDPSE